MDLDGGIWTPFAGCNSKTGAIVGSSPENIIDNNEETCGRAWFSTNIEIGNLQGGALRAKLDPPPDVGDYSVKAARIVVFVDRIPVHGYLYAPLRAYLEGPGGKILETELDCRSTNTDYQGNPIPTG